MEKPSSSWTEGIRISYCNNEKTWKPLKKEVDGFLASFTTTRH